MRIIRIAPNQMALERLLIDSSMKVAGRKIVASILMPADPASSSSSAASTPRVTSRVFAHGSFSTMSISPWPSLMTASPTSGHVPRSRSATSSISKTFPSTDSTGTWPRSSAFTMGRTCRT